MFDIKKAVEEVFEEVVTLRRDFHTHPEIGHKEFRTSRKVRETLISYGIEILENTYSTGVVALITGKNPGKCIALRADMDALPLQEETNLPFQSVNDGVMHACGHDGHTAMLLGAAKILNEHRAEFNGSVKLIFQPAEEAAPIGGSRGMIRAGALENPRPDAILAMHIFSTLSSGKMRVSEKNATVTGDPIEIEVFGKGGHSAEPNTAIDALSTACQIVCALQQIVTKNVDPLDMGVVSIGKIESGTQGNIISGYAKMSGVVRSVTKESRKAIKDAIERTVQGIGCVNGAKVELKYTEGYLSVENDPQMVHFVCDAAARYIGRENIEIVHQPSIPGSEDFSYYAEEGVPAVFMMLGGYKEGTVRYTNHNPKFIFDEETMKTGIMTSVAAAVRFLESNGGEDHEF